MRVFGVDVDPSPEARPGDLREAANSMLTVLELSLHVPTYRGSRVYESAELSAMYFLIDTAKETHRAASDIETSKNHSCK